MGVIACQTCYATTTQSASKSSKLCYQCVKGSQLVFEGLKRTVEKALIIIVGPTAVYIADSWSSLQCRETAGIQLPRRRADAEEHQAPSCKAVGVTGVTQRQALHPMLDKK